MKLLYINHKNANKLLTYSKKSPLIVKYYSPTCGACIGMQDEWEKLCEDLEKNYHGEVVVANVDPSGRDALDEYDIHTDIDGYPTILYLVKGKKKSEFEGPRTHENMLEWIGGHNIIKKKQNGGRKQTRKRNKTRMKTKPNKTNKTNKTKRTKRNKKSRRHSRGGSISQGISLGGIKLEKQTGNKYFAKNPETGEYEAHDEDCYGIGPFKTCKRSKEVSKKPWYSFW